MAKRNAKAVDAEKEIETVLGIDLGVVNMTEVAKKDTGESPVALGFLTEGDAPVPTYASAEASGMDLAAYLVEGGTVRVHDSANNETQRAIRGLNGEARHVLLEPFDRALIPTGVKAQIPHGYGLAIRPRSGTSFKKGLGLTNSVATIDSDYTGELFVSIINLSGARVKIEDGERIAQILVEKVYRLDVTKLEAITKETERGEGGFGSTGTK
ncbi:deoxyuridine triphosphatase [Stenotrophomonas phage Mendera]|uniref:dUTP diphosphatase n=1 Tax=Stenotrophomonas phage Mendera TaxID=2650877 RepID=A0A5P8PIT1_9CAUD|nr:dUTPase [Stenotrophomonas phage Mendera]QFR56579.1 deoxyuridine triphosphatase [Stenotrophomonas phage Mendera]